MEGKTRLYLIRSGQVGSLSGILNVGCVENYGFIEQKIWFKSALVLEKYSILTIQQPAYGYTIQFFWWLDSHNRRPF